MAWPPLPALPLCYMRRVLEPLDPRRPDPHDPLAPRPDDPRVGRWWWATRLYRRDSEASSFFRWPVLLGLMMVMIGLGALGVLLLAPPG